MPNRPARSFLATLVVVGSALPGFVGASASAAPVEPAPLTGGCWRYVPGPSAEIDDATDITDRSVSLEPWAAEPQLTLGTAGDTAVGGVRTFSLTVAGGPSVLPQLTETEGTATYFFDVVDPAAKRTELAPIVVDFAVPAGTTAIPAMQAEGSFPLAVSGTSALILRAVYFDLPDLVERLACNGQATGNATTNPATTPVDTSVLAGVTSVPATGVAAGRVVNEKVVNAARPGDGVDVILSGFASEARVSLGFCGPSADAGAAPSCGRTVEVATLPDGSARTALVVPDDAVIGAGSVRARSRVAAGDVVRDQPLRVLGKPELTLRESSGGNRLRLAGTQWNPLRQVRVMAVDDAGDRVGEAALVEAGPAGGINARLTIRDAGAVTEIVAVQWHRGKTLEATVDLPASGTGGDDTGAGAGAGAGSTDSSTGGTPAAAPDVAPVDIPAPIDLPVTTVADPQVGGAGADALAVTKVTLDGSTHLSDLFGGGPERVLKLKVENVSAADVIAPGLSIAVGKGKEADPVYTSDGFGRLAPGESRIVEIPIGLPAGAFGVYTVAGQIGGGASGAFSITWENYPWGLFGLNGLGILLIAFAVRRRILAPAPSRVAALVGARGAAVSASESGAGAAVIDLEVLERWWALQADGDGARETVQADAMADAVVDVAAVERWLERRSARNAEIG